MFDIDSLNKEIKELLDRCDALALDLDVAKIKDEFLVLRSQMEASNFWDDQGRAIIISRRAELLQKDLERWSLLENSLKEAQELLALSISTGDKSVLQDLSIKIHLWREELDNLESLSLYTGKYDERDAILSISAGTGGVDAQDWAQMLERMYLRFAEKQSWRVEILDRILANEAGIKSVMMKITGLRAYGNLKSENGTHRLLRNSPFNADSLRQTSFASVEVVPDIPVQEIEIKESDIRLDVFRSSGPGGQSVNTTDSAVRLVHLPTGITISCQSERSQHQNKENAFAILRAKLAKLELEKQAAEAKDLKGNVKAEWGQQVRSYWFYGNRLVKDHRSDFSSSDVDGVMDGDLDPFISAYLRWERDNL